MGTVSYGQATAPYVLGSTPGCWSEGSGPERDTVEKDGSKTKSAAVASRAQFVPASIDGVRPRAKALAMAAVDSAVLLLRPQGPPTAK